MEHSDYSEQPECLWVNRIQRFCVQDGPGIRTTVFAQGCPLRCWWCQNPDTQSLRTADSRAWNPIDLADEVEADARYWRRSAGGVTISGGECLMQPRALALFLTELGRRGVDRCVDTSGAVPTADLIHTSPHVDRWLFDIKAVGPERFTSGTGGSDAGLPLRNLDWLARYSNTPITVRVPVISGFNAGTSEPERIARLVQALPRAVEVEILPGHSVGWISRGAYPAPEADPRHIQETENAFSALAIQVTIRW